MNIQILKNFIDGEWQDSSTNRYLDDMNPATGQIIAKIPKSTSEDANSAIAAAKAAFKNWSSTPLYERAGICFEISQKIQKNLQEFAELESRDTGKPITLCLNLDIPRAVSNFQFFSEFVKSSSAKFFEMPNVNSRIFRYPVGVATLITPWNLPLYLLSWKLAPALIMGNTVVAKPSELTPLTANRLAELFEEVGAPKGIFNLVHGLGNEVGETLVSHADVNLVSFTGGTTTGRRVAELAAPTFKKLSLEMGGKNPTLVFADCDFEKTVVGVARSSFLNQGQICLCGSRILVEEKIFDKFVEALKVEVGEWKLGDPSDKNTKLGSLISTFHREKIEKYVQVAIDDGGTLITGGKRPQGHDLGAFFEPTIFTGVPVTSRAVTEEIFGPVVTVHPFKKEEEAIYISNSIKYGLSATIWTTDSKKAQRVAERIDAGTVWVNTWLMRDLRVPFGGMKDSGLGREGGEYSLDFFSETKTICTLTEPS